MGSTGSLYLMYHELRVPGRSLCCDERGYTRYVICQSDFRAHMDRLRETGLHGMSVGEALSGENACRGVVLTFDDGCETDLLVAAPLLRQLGFGATFYVVAGFLGRKGYMSPGQLRELSDLQFEIGCHSMSHAYLTDLEPAGLFTEIIEAKDRLQQLIGRRVDHLSCPGGRWSVQIACRAREAGYTSVATSRPGTNCPATDRFRLARIPMTCEISIAGFDALCRGKGLFKWRVQEAVLRLAKGMMGNSMYEKVRASLLRTSQP